MKNQINKFKLKAQDFSTSEKKFKGEISSLNSTIGDLKDDIIALENEKRKKDQEIEGLKEF